jgi:hypothetical protein
VGFNTLPSILQTSWTSQCAFFTGDTTVDSILTASSFISSRYEFDDLICKPCNNFFSFCISASQSLSFKQLGVSLIMVRRKALLIGINYTGQQHALAGCQQDVQNMVSPFVLPKDEAIPDPYLRPPFLSPEDTLRPLRRWWVVG